MKYLVRLWGLLFAVAVGGFADVNIFPLPQHAAPTGKMIPLSGNAWTIVLAADSDSLSQLGAAWLQEAFVKHQLSKPAIVTSPAPASRAIFLGTLEGKDHSPLFHCRSKDRCRPGGEEWNSQFLSSSKPSTCHI